MENQIWSAAFVMICAKLIADSWPPHLIAEHAPKGADDMVKLYRLAKEKGHAK